MLSDLLINSHEDIIGAHEDIIGAHPIIWVS